jgi:hypothetical protein
MIYGAQVWDVSRKKQNKLLATEMDCLQRRCRRSRLGRIQNETIRKVVEMEKDIIDDS